MNKVQSCSGLRATLLGPCTAGLGGGHTPEPGYLPRGPNSAAAAAAAPGSRLATPSDFLSPNLHVKWIPRGFICAPEAAALLQKAKYQPQSHRVTRVTDTWLSAEREGLEPRSAWSRERWGRTIPQYPLKGAEGRDECTAWCRRGCLSHIRRPRGQCSPPSPTTQSCPALS